MNASTTAARHLRHLALVIGSLALIGYVDAVTGYEVSLFLLYTIPVALATRYLGTRGGVLTAVAATGVWVWADASSGHAYSQPWILYVNAFNRMVCFLLAVGALRYVRDRGRAWQRRIDAFTGEVPLCTQCHRVGDGVGYWRSPEEHLREFGGADIHHKVCPDCARRAYARAAYRHPAEQGH